MSTKISLLTILGSIGASLVVTSLAPSNHPPSASASLPVAPPTALFERADAVDRRLRAIDVTRLSAAAPSPARDLTVDDAEIASAVAAWLAEHPAPVTPEPTTSEELFATLDLDTLIETVLDEMNSDAFQEVWAWLNSTGRMEEVLAELERRAADAPDDLRILKGLGLVQFTHFFDERNGPDGVLLGRQTDATFDRILARDENNWSARFSKALALSYWPPAHARTGEAIRQFEDLRRRQLGRDARPEHVETYLYLGNLYFQSGRKDKALEVWREGLGRHPDAQALQHQISSTEN